MYSNTKRPRTVDQKTPFCAYCKSIGESSEMYNSHFVHKTSSPNSRIVCPNLLKRVCTKCTSGNHTEDKCRKQEVVESKNIVVKVCLPVKNKFQIYEDSDSEEDDIESNYQEVEIEREVKREAKGWAKGWEEKIDVESGKTYWQHIATETILSYDPVKRALAEDDDW